MNLKKYATYRSRHGGPNEIFRRVQVDEGGRRGFEDVFNDVGGHYGLCHYGLATPLHPVHRSRLLVSAEVSYNTIRIRKVFWK